MSLAGFHKQLKKLNFSYSQENFFLLVFDCNNDLVHKELIFMGGLNEVHVDFKILFRKIFRIEKANGFIVAHNHTQYDLEPSSEDLTLTAKIHTAAFYLDLTFKDYIIFNEKKVLSMRDEGHFGNLA